MKFIAAIVVVSLVLVVPASAQVFGWRDADGRSVPDTEAKKSLNGFGAWIFTTSDSDWEAKWNTPQQPYFTEAHSVRKGEQVVTLIFLVNPWRDSSGDIDVRCDIRVTRPNGTISVDQRELVCMNGALEGDPFNLRLAGPVIPFVGEEGDPLGTWRVDVTLRDATNETTMAIRTSFEYVGDG